MELDLDLLLVAHKQHGCPSCDFQSDYNRINTIQQMLMRHRRGATTNYRLLVNHAVIMINSFGENMAMFVINHVMHEKFKPLLNSILIYAQRVPITAPHDSELLRILNDL